MEALGSWDHGLEPYDIGGQKYWIQGQTDGPKAESVQVRDQAALVQTLYYTNVRCIPHIHA